MPNHITNRITADAETLRTVAEALRGAESAVDFNRLVPMPDDIQVGDLTMEERKASGGRNWYDWSRQNWGTKWNAYDVVVTAGEVAFDTAWSCPEPIVRALAKEVGGTWLWSYADEDIGHNCGQWFCRDGVLAFTGVPEGCDPVEFACEIKGCDPADYRD